MNCLNFCALKQGRILWAFFSVPILLMLASESWAQSVPTITDIKRVDTSGTSQPAATRGQAATGGRGRSITWEVVVSVPVFSFPGGTRTLPTITNYFSVTGAPTGTRLTSTKPNATTYRITLTGRGLNNFSGPLTLAGPTPGLFDTGMNALSSAFPASAEATYQFDNKRPTVSIGSPRTAVNNRTPFDITVTFDEPVTGFTIGALTVTGGAASSLRGPTPTAGGEMYTIRITPGAFSSDVTLRVTARVVTDQLNNRNRASALSRVRWDVTPPTVTSITSSESRINSTTALPFDVTVTFSESVSGFALADLTVTNGMPSNLRGSGTTYIIAITPDGGGDLSFSIAANVATDAAGNGNQAGPTAPLVVPYDATRPTTTITSSESSINSTTRTPFDVTVTFSESVSGFALADLTVTNGMPSNLRGPTVVPGGGEAYTIAVTPNGRGDLSLSVAANVATDAAGNGNQAAVSVLVTYDITPPTVTSITSSESRINSTTALPFDVTVTFSESVSGFALADLTVTNGTPSNLRGSGTTYIIAITPDGGGDLSFSIAANVATDAAGNGNQATATPPAAPLVVPYDATRPTTTITSSEGSINSTTALPFDVTVTFSESVSGFALTDLTVTNGTPSNLRGSGTTYTIAVTPNGRGNLTLSVAANVATNGAGNGNQAAVSVLVTYDITPPTVTSITSSASIVNSTTAFDVTVVFSETVNGFIATDLTVTNGTPSNLRGSGTTYIIAITPDGGGDLSFSIAANVATDAAGNGNQATATPPAAPLVVPYDATRPTTTITSSEGSINSTTALPFDVTVTFSESVSGFALTDLTVTNGTPSNLRGSGTTYTIAVTPNGGGNLTLSIAANVATNGAGNGNQAAVSVLVAYDATRPTATITSSESVVNSISAFDITVTFSETVNGFIAADLTITNGTTSDLRGSGTTYIIAVIPDGGDDLTLSVAANVAEDDMGNGNQAAASVTINWQAQTPAVNPVAPSLNLLGRMAGIQIADLVAIRVESDLASGLSGTIAGQNIQPHNPDSQAGGRHPAAFPQGERVALLLDDFSKNPTSPMGNLENAGEILSGTSSSYVSDTDSGAKIALWGQGTWQRFRETETDTELKGEIMGFSLSADYQKNNRLFGLMLSRSHSDVTYRNTGTELPVSEGRAKTHITALIPYASMQLLEDLRGWASFGFGWGTMRLKPKESPRRRTSVGWKMAATGLQGALIKPSEVSSFGLDVTADFLQTWTSSQAIAATQSLPGYTATLGKTNRLRFGLDHRWEQSFQSDKILIPHLGLAVRRDGGDGDPGWGLELETGVKMVDRPRGLDISVSGHTLILHGKNNFQNQGLRLSLTLDPQPDSQQGWSIRMWHGFGGLLDRGSLLTSELFPQPDKTQESLHLWTMETAYGFSLGQNYVGSPYVELSGNGVVDQVRSGYRVNAEAPYRDGLDFEIYEQSDLKNRINSVGFNLSLRW